MSFEIVRAKTLFCPKKCNTNFYIEITSIVSEFITVLCLFGFVDMMQSMNGVV